MRVIVTGQSGLIGRYLLRTADPSDTIYSTRFDILNQEAVNAAFNEARPEIVIHAAGESRVDVAESDPRMAWRLNVHGTSNILKAASNWESHVVYISSNAVYAGDDAPYDEEMECRPVNVYGKTKLEAERSLLCYPFKGTIIRPILLYGIPNPGKRAGLDQRVIQILSQGEDYRNMKVADDIYSQPTYAADCAMAIWMLARNQTNIKEIYNVGGPQKISLYDFAVEVAKAYGLNTETLGRAKGSDFTGLAPRPKDTTFNLRKAFAAGMLTNTIQHGLRLMRVEQS